MRRPDGMEYGGITRWTARVLADPDDAAVIATRSGHGSGSGGRS